MAPPGSRMEPPGGFEKGSPDLRHDQAFSVFESKVAPHVGAAETVSLVAAVSKLLILLLTLSDRRRAREQPARDRV